MELQLLCQKELRELETDGPFNFPARGLRAFGLRRGDRGTEFQAFDADNVPWMFHLRIRAGGHPKPVTLASTWRPFVKDKQLRDRDRIMFFSEETPDGPRFHVGAQRKCINLVDDADYYVDVESLRNTSSFFSVSW